MESSDDLKLMESRIYSFIPKSIQLLTHLNTSEISIVLNLLGNLAGDCSVAKKYISNMLEYDILDRLYALLINNNET